MNHQNNDKFNLDEAAAANKTNDSELRSRIALVRNTLRLGSSINTSLATSAVNDYINRARKNPNHSHFRILRDMSPQKRDAVSSLKLPVATIVNTTMPQLRRTLRDMREETELLNEEFNPPAVLVLRRQAIRMFPNRQRVVMYTDSKYGLTFPVPYDLDKGFGDLNTYARTSQTAAAGFLKEEVVPVLFATGEEINIEKDVFKKIENLYSMLNEQNKIRLNDMILESKESFNKIKKFTETIQ